MKKPTTALCHSFNHLKRMFVLQCLPLLSFLFLIYISLPVQIRAQSAQANLNNSQELEALLDPIFTERMQTLHVQYWKSSEKSTVW